MKKAIMALIAAAGMALSGTAEAGWSDGMISVTNARPDGVKVMVDRSYVGSVMPADAEAFAISPGRHHVVVTCSKGYTLAEETVNIEPFEAESIMVQAQPAALSMTNAAGTSLTIMVDGETLTTLRPNEQTSLRIPAGAHKVKAVYRQHNRNQTLVSQKIRFSPGQTESLRLTPASVGMVKVVNDFDQTASIRINGQDMGSVRAGKSKIVEAPLGSVRAELLIGNRVVAAERLSVRRYHDTTFEADEPIAMEGRLELSNHRSGTVKIYINGRLSGSIPAWSERTFTLPLGSHQVRAVSASNKVIYNRVVDINRYDETEIELGAQSSVPTGGTSECSAPGSYY